MIPRGTEVVVVATSWSACIGTVVNCDDWGLIVRPKYRMRP